MSQTDSGLLEKLSYEGLRANGKGIRFLIPKKKKESDEPSKSRDQAVKRLVSLAEKEQERISQKYYGGCRPWIDSPYENTVPKRG